MMLEGRTGQREPAGLTSNVPFVSGHGLSLAVTALFVAYIVVALFGVVSNLLQINLLTEALTGDITQEQAASNDLRQGAVAILTLLVFVALIVVFLLWLYRASRNLPALGNVKSRIEYSPGWTVGSFFIPFLNLFYPYRAISEIWAKSEPLIRTEDDFMFTPTSSAGLVLVWWISWIAMNVVSRAAARFQSDTATPDTLRWVTWVEVVADLLGILSAILAILVVRGIDRRQEARSRNVTYIPHTPPPLFTPPQGT